MFFVVFFFFWSGEVILWDLSQNDDLVLASSGIGDDAHREPVSKVHWMKSHSSKRRDYNVTIMCKSFSICMCEIYLYTGH